jgi:bifunctional DNase/RNase
MPKDFVAINVKAVIPTANGSAVFLGNEDKTFVIYVDHHVGAAIQGTLNGVKKERPQTHDLIGSIFLGLGVTLDHVVINDANEGTFYARIFLRMENELGKKLLEIDARPSDSIVLALQANRPISVTEAVFERVEDMTEDLEQALKQQANLDDSFEEDEEDVDENEDEDYEENDSSDT